jgi:hypothetical protein
MCRNIRTLHHFKPPTTAEEIHAASLQYVRKVSGMREPSKDAVAAFERAVAQIAAATSKLLDALPENGVPRTRESEGAVGAARASDSRSLLETETEQVADARSDRHRERPTRSNSQ